MSLGIIQRERTAYGRVRADEHRGEESGERWERNPQQSLSSFITSFLDVLTVVCETSFDWQCAMLRLQEFYHVMISHISGSSSVTGL